jgi:hypothetical protein
VSFEAETVRVAPIRVEDAYGGQRVRVHGLLGKARLAIRVDVGIGDAVTPPPEWIDYPSLLDLPRPRLRAYRPETTIAEKVHAMATLGMANSRMRDFFDVYELARRYEFDGAVLASAIRETFGRRRTCVARELPEALTPAFGEDTGKRTQWRAFLQKNRLEEAPLELSDVILTLDGFVGPVLMAVASDQTFSSQWPASGPWRPR